MSDSAVHPTLDGRRFAALSRAEDGEVGPETVFEYHESDGEIWASYAGGAVRRGFLVGTRAGDTVTFRYSQLNQDLETSNGRCVSEITRAENGRLRLNETWEWESKPGSGTNVVEEIDD